MSMTGSLGRSMKGSALADVDERGEIRLRKGKKKYLIVSGEMNDSFLRVHFIILIFRQLFQTEPAIENKMKFMLDSSRRKG